MHIRSIAPDELAAFASVPGDAERSAAIKEVLGTYLADGITHPRFLWIAEDEEQWLGRVAYTANRGETEPSYLVWLDVAAHQDETSVASALIRESLAHLRTPSLRQVEGILDAPSPFTADPRQSAQLLSAGGFHLSVDRRRFEWTLQDPLPPSTPRLIFRTLADVGDEAFIATMARITEGSLDHYTQESVRELGPLEAARQHFHDEQRYQERSEPHWWQLGLLPDGQVAGLVMPAENVNWPNIGYIGVVPEQRGHGFCQDLLAQGTRTLVAEGAKRIIADTDVGNVPMANGFLRMGYRQFATRQFWTLQLAPE